MDAPTEPAPDRRQDATDVLRRLVDAVVPPEVIDQVPEVPDEVPHEPADPVTKQVTGPGEA